MKLEQGDAFERKHADWIRKHLPSYEDVWSAFIGHDGSGVPCAMRELDEPKAEARKRFYQAHYSFVAKVIFVENEATAFGEDLGQVTDDTLEEATERLFSIMCAVGYIRDMFKKMDEALKSKGILYDQLQKFYAERSHVIHGPRLPYLIDDDGLIMIPRIGGENALDTEWIDSSTWDKIPKENYVHIATFVQDLAGELRKAIVLHHGKVFDAADTFFDKRRIDPDCGSTGGDPPSSGTTIPSGLQHGGGFTGLSGVGP